MSDLREAAQQALAKRKPLTVDEIGHLAYANLTRIFKGPKSADSWVADDHQVIGFAHAVVDEYERKNGAAGGGDE